MNGAMPTAAFGLAIRLRAPDLNVPGIASRSWNATDAAIKSGTRTTAQAARRRQENSASIVGNAL